MIRNRGVCRICGIKIDKRLTLCDSHSHLAGLNLCPICGNSTKNKYCSDKCRDIGTNYCDKTCCGKAYKGNIYSKLCPDCKPDPKVYKLSKFAVHLRDDFKCVYCGKSSIEDGVILCAEHVNPEYTIENNRLINLVTSCSICNVHKGNMKLDKNIVKRIIERNKKLMALWPDDIVKLMEDEFNKVFINTVSIAKDTKN